MPQGLGINRGFLHSLDCADLAAGFAAVVATREAAAGEETAAAAERARRGGAQLLRNPNPPPNPSPSPNPSPNPNPNQVAEAVLGGDETLLPEHTRRCQQKRTQ